MAKWAKGDLLIVATVLNSRRLSVLKVFPATAPTIILKKC